ncbi:hypothetical protein F8S13_22110 [Chloroflexia bacterium SDU3-3]|nr:hypothetical protein F8S13_22110 [Chloroflexia bacterium SDU3-3]
MTARDLGAGCYQIVLTLGRADKPVGATEEITFRRDCLVPIGAQRYPAAPTAQVARVEDGVRWNLIGYTWVATAALWQGGAADVAEGG